MDKMNTPISIFLDLSKAFDTLDHGILLSKLKYYGLCGTSLQLMESYISNRKQYVTVDGTDSEPSQITTGVPQSSIRGPLLFIIYINDIVNASNLFKFIIYADDIILSTTLEIIMENQDNSTINSKINYELSRISDWLKTNKLSLNASKTRYMIFHTPQKRINPLHIKINDTDIE